MTSDLPGQPEQPSGQPPVDPPPVPGYPTPEYPPQYPAAAPGYPASAPPGYPASAPPGYGYPAAPGYPMSGPPAYGQVPPGYPPAYGQVPPGFPPPPAKTSARKRGIIIGAIAGVVIVVAAVGLYVGLSRDTKPAIGQYLDKVEVLGEDGATSTLVNNDLPSGSPSGPTVDSLAETTVINGGSVLVPVTSSQTFTKVRVALEALGKDSSGEVKSSSGKPSRGYHEVTLRNPSTQINLLISVNQHLPEGGFELYYAAVDGDGEQGPRIDQSVKIIAVGTGGVQVSISWDAPSDTDLHVIDPNGERIFWASRDSSSGGHLDLDSNAGCDLDYVQNENVTWEGGDAPDGTYEVYVDYYAACGVARTNYVVTVHVEGTAPQTFTGTLTGLGDYFGSDSDPIKITSFTL